MGVTTLEAIYNRSNMPVIYVNQEYKDVTPIQIDPGRDHAINHNIPWNDNYIALGPLPNNNPVRIWQSNDDDGDFIRHSIDGVRQKNAPRVPGESAVDGNSKILEIKADGSIQLFNSGEEFSPFDSLAGTGIGKRSAPVKKAVPPKKKA